MKKLSLKWRLTLVTAGLVTAACLTLNLFISYSAFSQMDEVENYVLKIDPVGEGDLTVELSADQLYPELSGQMQKARAAFLAQSVLATVAVILLCGVLTYYLSGRALAPLRRFSANAAHEFRTPLAVMQTRLDVLQKKESPTTEEYEETVRMLREQVSRLSRLIDVLLEMTELQTVKRTDQISMATLTEEVLCDLEEIAGEKEVTLVQGNGEAFLTGNDTLIYRAVYNLVENAVKYNRPGGKVTVDIREENGAALLSVADTGTGIARENWERIFEPFVREDKSRSRAMGGAGLGLALVREIAVQHGGNVRVEESSPQGTRIRLMLPASAHPAE